MTDPIQLARECGFTPVNYSLETPPEADDVFIATHEQLVLLISRARAEVMEECAALVKTMHEAGWDNATIVSAIRAMMQEEGR